jgi:hypothetical protein
MTAAVNSDENGKHFYSSNTDMTLFYYESLINPLTVMEQKKLNNLNSISIFDVINIKLLTVKKNYIIIQTG